jgi:hypothetical protein
MPNIYFHPKLFIDPTAAPIFPRWRVPAYIPQQQYNFTWKNLPVLAEPVSLDSSVHPITTSQ